MAWTENIGITYVDPNQAQAHITVNEALNVIDMAIAGQLGLSLTSGARELSGWESTHAFIRVISATQAATITIQAVSKAWIFINDSSRAMTVKAEDSAVTASVPAGEMRLLICDGADIRAVTAGGGGTGTSLEPATLADLQAGVNTSRFINPAVASAWRDVANGVVGIDDRKRSFLGSSNIPSAISVGNGGLALSGGGAATAGGDGNTPALFLVRWSNDSGGLSIIPYKARNTGGAGNMANVAASDNLFAINGHGFADGFLGITVGLQAFIASGYTVENGIIPEGVLHLRVALGNAASGAPTRGVTVASATFHPYSDNTTSLGYSGRRWTDAYVTSGTIQTSDARAKAIVDFPEEILDVWAEISPVFYKLNDSIETKGQAEARVHAGYIAQAIKEAFEFAGLDAHQYGFFCYDEWEAEPEQKDDDGQVIQAASPAGNRYSLRYEQCAVIEAAYQRRRAARLEARLAAMEERLAALEAKLEQF